MTVGAVAAVDLGASSGRVVVGEVGPGRLAVDEVHRFPNDPIDEPDGLHWDIRRLYSDVVDGLRRADRAAGGLASIGIDSWGLDCGFLDADGALLGNPVHYRDPRFAAGVARVHSRIPPDRLYSRNGLQFLPFNTIYQLATAQAAPGFDAARTLLLIPDLIAFWLTGERSAEQTNASTTGLLDPVTRRWAWDLIDELSLARDLFPDVRMPGTRLAPVLPDVAGGAFGGTVVTLVGTHDTASAVVGVPAEGADFAYISSGTWSLVGMELDEPVLTEQSRAANFTNEAGVDGRVRYLRNVMGLWLLQESLRAWDRAGTPERLESLLTAAAAMPSGGPVVDADDLAFLPPGDMPARIAEACRSTGQPLPGSKPAVVRCIVDSLAAAYARAIADATRLSGRHVNAVHLVGGGARNELLCQLTADACGRPVLAGPVEATALGNILVQARSLGRIEGDLGGLRALVRATQPIRRFDPVAHPATPLA